MGRVRTMPKCIKKKHIQPLKFRLGCLRNLAVIGKIGSRAETKSENRRLAVQHRNRSELQTKQIERITIQRIHIEPRNRRARRRVLKGIAENALDSVQRGGGSMQRNRLLLSIVERPHTVETEDVIGVRVRVNDCIDTLN